MARSVTHTHFFVERVMGKSFRNEPLEESLGLCGEQSCLHNRFTTDEHKVNCPKCSAKLGTQRLKEFAEKGISITLEKLAEKDRPQKFSSMRGVYAVTYQGDPIGWIVNDHGWGKGWDLYNLRNVSTDARRDNTYSALGRFSKEHLAAEIPALIESGKLPTKQTVDQENADRKAQLDRYHANVARREEEQRQERADRARRTGEATEAIESVLARFAGQLSNTETHGLQEALKLLKKEG